MMRINRKRTKYASQIAAFNVNDSGIVTGTESMPFSVGHIAQRKATDVFFGICLLVFGAIVFIIGIWALATGQPLKIIAPVNGYGEMCGYGKAKSTPFKFYPLDYKGHADTSLCVSSCPTSNMDPPNMCVTDSVEPC